MLREQSSIANLKPRILSTLRNSRDEYELMDAIRTYNDDFPAYLSAKLEAEAAIELLRGADRDYFANPEIAAELLDVLRYYRRYLAESGWAIRKRVVDGLIGEMERAYALDDRAA